MSFADSHHTINPLKSYHKLWYDLAGGSNMPTKDCKYWDQVKVGASEIYLRQSDSVLGLRRPTIVQLDENVIDLHRFPLYIYPRTYAQELHVVDWSGLRPDTHEDYIRGLELRYGPMISWLGMDFLQAENSMPAASGDRNVYRIGPPPAYIRPGNYQKNPPRTQYITASFGTREWLNTSDFWSVMTHTLPPIGFVPMWQEKQDVLTYKIAWTDREIVKAKKRYRDIKMIQATGDKKRMRLLRIEMWEEKHALDHRNRLEKEFKDRKKACYPAEDLSDDEDLVAYIRE